MVFWVRQAEVNGEHGMGLHVLMRQHSLQPAFALSAECSCH